MNIGICAAINSFDMEKIRISSGSPLEALLGTWHEWETDVGIAGCCGLRWIVRVQKKRGFSSSPTARAKYFVCLSLAS
jgi:hypothetical protein